MNLLFSASCFASMSMTFARQSQPEGECQASGASHAGADTANFLPILGSFGEVLEAESFLL